MDSRSSCNIFCQILDVPSKCLVTTFAKRKGQTLNRVVSLQDHSLKLNIPISQTQIFILNAEKYHYVKMKKILQVVYCL